MDVKCVVCGEPWDYHHVMHDMEPWARKLFREGAGCPECEGEPPNGELFEPRGIGDFEFGDRDAQERIDAWASAPRPKWERPPDEVLWTCAGCGVQVVRNQDFDPKEAPDLAYEYRVPPKAKCREWYHSHPFYKGEPGPEPAHVFGEGRAAQPVCEFCLNKCDDCGKPLCGTIDFSDCYDEGYSFLRPGCYNRSDSLCVDCFANYCNRCENRYEECSCLSEAISEVEKAYDLDDSPTEEDVGAWLREHGRSASGEDLEREDVKQAFVALGYLESEKEE